MSQLVDDEPHRCFAVNISPKGLYMERPISVLERTRRAVQIELSLPASSETLWVGADVVYDCFDNLFHGTAVRFTAMARKHRHMLREWMGEVARTTFGLSGEIVHVAPGIRILRPPPPRP